MSSKAALTLYKVASESKPVFHEIALSVCSSAAYALLVSSRWQVLNHFAFHDIFQLRN